MKWTKGRGKLGVFDPLIGTWQAEAESDLGFVKCRREFKNVLSGKYIQLKAHWEYDGKTYDELALFGVNEVGEISFWSFTSDGKQALGRFIDVNEIHPQAISFEAEMPAGIARQVYWPADEGGFYWAVESKNKKGWKRFVEHHYLPVAEENG